MYLSLYPYNESMEKLTGEIKKDLEKIWPEIKTLTVEEELGKALDALYTKNVPAGVREFIELRAGLTPASASTPKAKKPKPSAPSAVGEVPAAQEVSSHEQH